MLQVPQLAAAQAMIGHPTMRWNNWRILNAIAWQPVQQMVNTCMLIDIHRTIHTDLPEYFVINFTEQFTGRHIHQTAAGWSGAGRLYLGRLHSMQMTCRHRVQRMY